MAGNCKDAGFGPLMAIVAAGGCFSNPQTSNIAGLATGVYSRQSALAAFIVGLPSGPLLTNCLALQTALGNFAGTSGGGYGLSCLGSYKAHTDFLSGAQTYFPSAALGGYMIFVPNSALLGGLTFTSVLGIANGGLATTSALCNTDPVNPCGPVAAIFNSTLGGLQSVISGMVTAIAAMTDFAGSVATYLAQVSGTSGFIATINDVIIAELSSLTGLIQQGLNFALSKLIQVLNANPCFTSLINAVASPALIAAIPPVT